MGSLVTSVSLTTLISYIMNFFLTTLFCALIGLNVQKVGACCVLFWNCDSGQKFNKTSEEPEVVFYNSTHKLVKVKEQINQSSIGSDDPNADGKITTEKLPAALISENEILSTTTEFNDTVQFSPSGTMYKTNTIIY